MVAYTFNASTGEAQTSGSSLVYGVSAVRVTECDPVSEKEKACLGESQGNLCYLFIGFTKMLQTELWCWWAILLLWGVFLCWLAHQLVTPVRASLWPVYSAPLGQQRVLKTSTGTISHGGEGNGCLKCALWDNHLWDLTYQWPWGEWLWGLWRS